MEATKEYKRAGRKPKAKKDKVVSKGVYLTNAEWKVITDRFGSPTNAMRHVLNLTPFILK